MENQENTKKQISILEGLQKNLKHFIEDGKIEYLDNIENLEWIVTSKPTWKENTWYRPITKEDHKYRFFTKNKKRIDKAKDKLISVQHKLSMYKWAELNQRHNEDLLMNKYVRQYPCHEEEKFLKSLKEDIKNGLIQANFSGYKTGTMNSEEAYKEINEMWASNNVKNSGNEKL